MTVEEKLEEIERLLIDSIHNKAVNGENLSTYEMQLVIKWLKPKATPKGLNLSSEPIITKGQPLPFLLERLPFEEAIEALEDVK